MSPQKKLYKAIAKSMLSRYAAYIVNLLSMIILARFFTPDIFGTVAAITVFYVFFQIMSEAGMGPAIINLDHLEPDNRNGLFGLMLSIGFIFSILFVLIAPIFRLFYRLPSVEEVVPYVAISLLFYAASIIPNAFLLRDQAFVRIANASIVSELFSTAAVIWISRYIEPLHALASKGAFSAASSFCALYYFSANTEFGRPIPGRKFSAIKPLLSFTGHQFCFNFINYFSRNLDNILIGRYMGSEILGVYDKAYQLMKYPLMLLTFAMTPAIQPVIRKHAGDKLFVAAIHNSFAFKLSLLGAGAGLMVFLLADSLVLIVLGNQWGAVVPIIKVLAIAIPVQVVLSTSGSFFQAMNRTDLLFKSGTLSAILMVSAIAIGIYMRDVILLCWSLVIVFHINFFQTYYFMYTRVYCAGFGVFLLRMTLAGSLVVGMIFHSLLKCFPSFCVESLYK